MTTPRLRTLEPLLDELSPEEMRELVAELTQRAGQFGDTAKPIDWEKYRGLLKHGPDAVEYQRAIRTEWD